MTQVMGCDSTILEDLGSILHPLLSWLGGGSYLP